MTAVATTDRVRLILNKLIFDPSGITWKKSQELELFSENKVLEIYHEVIRDTGHINFDEVVIRILFHNEIILLEAIKELVAEDPCFKDEVICDNTRIYRQLERGEISCRDTIPDYVCRILNKHNLAYIPFMESKHNSPVFREFGVEGICVINDCQNRLFEFDEDAPCDFLGLKEIYGGQCNVVRTLLEVKGMIA